MLHMRNGHVLWFNPLAWFARSGPWVLQRAPRIPHSTFSNGCLLRGGCRAWNPRCPCSTCGPNPTKHIEMPNQSSCPSQLHTTFHWDLLSFPPLLLFSFFSKFPHWFEFLSSQTTQQIWAHCPISSLHVWVLFALNVSIFFSSPIFSLYIPIRNNAHLIGSWNSRCICFQQCTDLGKSVI